MENITPYDIALIGGGFTIVGALIAAVVAYWLTTKLEIFKEKRAACTSLHAAFAPRYCTNLSCPPPRNP